MSWVRIWVHLVFSTKNNTPLLNSIEIRQKVFQHIKEEAEKKEIKLNAVNGYNSHAHCLLLLGKEQSISNVAKLIKGESSHWINKEQLTKHHFGWQDDYWAVSISESHVKSVQKYICNQEEHHRKKSFSEEVDVFMKKYGWEYLKS